MTNLPIRFAYDKIQHDLAEMRKVDEVKAIIDKAAAMQEYARRAQDTSLIENATAIRDKAETRAGEILIDMAERGERAISGDKESGRGKKPLSKPSLSDLGISKTQSFRWRRKAKLKKSSPKKWQEKHDNIIKKAVSAVEGKEASSLIQQSSSAEHYTPKKYIDAARRVLGSIDLDPASCLEANKVIRANSFFDVHVNGLKQQWSGTVWLNPPYGKLPGSFIEKLCHEIKAKAVTSAIVLVNAHCTDTIWFQPLWDGCLCFTDHRINFTGDKNRSGSTHGSVFIYFGGNRKGFIREFSKFGTVVERVK